jgi:hypothetical protein
LLDCRLRDISTAVVFLEKRELVTVYRKARYVDGEPRGSMVYVIPNLERIDVLLTEVENERSLLMKKTDEDETRGVATSNSRLARVPDSGTQAGAVQHTAPAKSGTQRVEVQHHNLNVPKARNDNVGRAARQVTQTSASSPSCHLARSEAGGGGAADAESTSPPSPTTPQYASSKRMESPAHNAQRAEGLVADVRSQSQVLLEKRISRFIYFWSEAGRRSGHLDFVNVSHGDRKALSEFFMTEKVKASWMAAVAINAWQAGDELKKNGRYDGGWACRRARDIQTFLRLRNRILNELGANGYKVNAYKDLREWFTDSELNQHGFEINAGLGVVSSDDCWENDEDAPAYYERNGLEMPLEVQASLNTRNRSVSRTDSRPKPEDKARHGR